MNKINNIMEKIANGTMIVFGILFTGYMLLWLVWAFWIGIGICK